LPKPEFVVNGKFYEQGLAEARDSRLSILLTQETIDNEDIWINYESEETELKVAVTEAVVDHLLAECINILRNIE